MTRDRLMFLATAVLLVAWVLSGPASPDAINVAYRVVNYDSNGNLTVPGGVNVSSGQKMGFAGSAGTTYMILNSSTGCVESYASGSLGWQMCATFAVPPDCPANTSSIPFGGMCKDQDSGHLKIHATLVETF